MTQFVVQPGDEKKKDDFIGLRLRHPIIWQFSQRKQHVSSYIGSVHISAVEFA